MWGEVSVGGKNSKDHNVRVIYPALTGPGKVNNAFNG
jgi:hypothetical protein